MPVLKSLPDTIKELQVVRLATLLKWHPHSGQKQPPEVFLEILQNSQEDTCTRVSFLINLQAPACNFINKETLAQVFSY